MKPQISLQYAPKKNYKENVLKNLEIDWCGPYDGKYIITVLCAVSNWIWLFCENNIAAKKICNIMDKMKPLEGMDTYKELITFVKDRPGHDFRYAIDSTKVQKELNFYPSENIDTGLKKTINWYLNNLEWINNIRSNKYNQERLGVI